MSAKYCQLCERLIAPKRTIGVGTLILFLFSGGFWLLAIPFYRKKCPICKGSVLADSKPVVRETNPAAPTAPASINITIAQDVPREQYLKPVNIIEPTKTGYQEGQKKISAAKPPSAEVDREVNAYLARQGKRP